MKLEPAIDAAFARGEIPDHISPEYLMETRDPPAIASLIFLVILAGIVVGGRCLSRLLIVKSFGLDDSLALFSFFLFVAFVVLCIILINLGSGRHIEYIQYVLSEPQTNLTESLDFIAHLIYTTALYVCRMSGLAFYLRLCSDHQVLSIAIKGGAIFLTAAYLPQIFLIIFHCLPVTSLWPYAWQPTAADFKCLMWGTVYVVNSGLSLVCDLLLFTLPIFMILSLKISKQKRIKLSLVLLPGVLVIIISIVRLYLVVQGQWLTDGSWYYNPMLAIETAEIAGTLIALSIPGLKPLFSSWLKLGSAVPTTHGSDPQLVTIGSKPSRQTRALSKLGNRKETSAGTGTAANRISRYDGESDVNLVGEGDGSRDKETTIQVRRSLNIDSASVAGSDIKLEMYPRNWEHNH